MILSMIFVLVVSNGFQVGYSRVASSNVAKIEKIASLAAMANPEVLTSTLCLNPKSRIGEGHFRLRI